MKKTCISTLLVVLLGGARMAGAQESMDDVLAQLDAANQAGGEPVASAASAAQVDDVAPAAVEGANKGNKAAAAASQSEIIKRLMDKGVALYRKGEFEKALTTFDTVIALDSYNARAAAYKERTAQHIFAEEGAKRTTTRALAMAEIKDMWSTTPEALASAGTPKNDADKANEAAVQKMEARLKSIKIPLLDFQNASIRDIMLFLAAGSRKADPQGKGVNILLMGMDSADESVNLSLKITDISLYDALNMVAGMSSFKLEIRPNAVAVMPAAFVPQSEMVTKSYRIIPEVGDELKAAAGGSDSSAEDLFGDSSSSSSDKGPTDVSGFFSVVDFPDGAVATYQPRFHKLFVKNTPRNLAAIESILDDLEEKAILRRSQQVEIEAKFVEFNEGDLQELGFDWNIYGSGSVAGMKFDPRNAAPGIDQNTGVNLLQNGEGSDGRPGENFFGGSALRNSSTAFAAAKAGLFGLLGGTPATMMMGNGDVDVMITALEQNGTADVLSAPKVTTKSGSEAIIRVAETHRYPQDYDVETGQRTSPVVKPQDWADFDLGVTLKVTPEVNAENNTIDLTLFPQSMKFLGYEEYRVGSNGYKAPDGSDAKADPSLFAKMPYFRRRSVETQVTIADGTTAVMGGLVDETTETFRDQVPILGDIPYLGRLFRSEGTRSVKKNLVIYVTAKQVDASGMSVAERELARASKKSMGAL